MDTYDIAIIGAGPAGSTLARLLSGTYRRKKVGSGLKDCNFIKYLAVFQA